LLLLSGVDLTRAESAKSSINYIASEAARCAAKPPCVVGVFVTGSAAGLGLNSSQISFTQAGNAVTVLYTFQPLFGFFPTLSLSSTATAN